MTNSIDFYEKAEKGILTEHDFKTIVEGKRDIFLWHTICYYQNLSHGFIKRNLDLVDWVGLFSGVNYSINLIIAFTDHFVENIGFEEFAMICKGNIEVRLFVQLCDYPELEKQLASYFTGKDWEWN